jgi:hypothetical protein
MLSAYRQVPSLREKREREEREREREREFLFAPSKAYAS